MDNEDPREYPVPTTNSAIADFLYPQPAERRTGAIIKWWEARRLAFNLIVGGSGLVTLAAVAIASSIPPAAPGFRFFLTPIVAYGVLANLCYTLGPVIEIAVQKLWGRDVLPTGPVLFRAGLTFSVGLTLVLPVVLVTLGWVARIVFAIF